MLSTGLVSLEMKTRLEQLYSPSAAFNDLPVASVMLDIAAFLSRPLTVPSASHLEAQVVSARLTTLVGPLRVSCAKCAVLMLSMLIRMAADVADPVSSNVKGVHNVNSGFGPISPMVIKRRDVTLQ